MPTYESIPEKIKRLEAEHSEARAKLKSEGYTTANLDACKELSTKISDLKQRQQSEDVLKLGYKNKFLAAGVGDADDFERLWETQLRDQALLAKAGLAQEPPARAKAASHPIWSSI